MGTTEVPTPTPAKRARRHYPPELKAELVAKASAPGASVSSVAREHGINANQLFKWIRAARLAAATDDSPSPRPDTARLVPVSLAAPNAPSAMSGAAAALEIALPQATLRFGTDWEPARVAALVRLLGS